MEFVGRIPLLSLGDFFLAYVNQFELIIVAFGNCKAIIVRHANTSSSIMQTLTAKTRILCETANSEREFCNMAFLSGL